MPPAGLNADSHFLSLRSRQDVKYDSLSIAAGSLSQKLLMGSNRNMSVEELSRVKECEILTLHQG